MKNILFLLLLFSNHLFAQDSTAMVSIKDTATSFICGRHSVTAGFGKGSLFYLNYEFKLTENKWLKTTASFGYGNAPGDSESDIPSYNNLSLGIHQYIGIRPLFVSVGLLPTINFYGKLTYTELNGKLGLQYVVKNCEFPIVIEGGSIIRLYRTHYNDVGPFIYLGFGINIP